MHLVWLLAGIPANRWNTARTKTEYEGFNRIMTRPDAEPLTALEELELMRGGGRHRGASLAARDRRRVPPVASTSSSTTHALAGFTACLIVVSVPYSSW
jgi:hypothetical protein